MATSIYKNAGQVKLGVFMEQSKLCALIPQYVQFAKMIGMDGCAVGKVIRITHADGILHTRVVAQEFIGALNSSEWKMVLRVPEGTTIITSKKDPFQGGGKNGYKIRAITYTGRRNETVMTGMWAVELGDQYTVPAVVVVVA